MHVPNWRRYVPYAPLISAVAATHRVEAALLAAFIAAETGGTFCPWSYVASEKAAGLGQVRFGLGLVNHWGPETQWWDPSLAINACATAIQHIAYSANLPTDSLAADDWVRLRVAYTHGPAGRRALLARGAREHETRAAVNILKWRDALLNRPVDHPAWNAGATTRDLGALEALPGLERVAHTDWGVEQTNTEWGRAFFRDLLDDEFVDAAGARFSLREALRRTTASVVLGRRLGAPAPDAVTQARQRRLLVLCAQVGRLARAYCGLTGPLMLTSVHRREGEGAKNPRYTVRVSQHTRHAAADLGLGALNRSGRPSSVIALARLVRGWAIGPELTSLGGMGVYKGTPSMLHVDVRPRVRGVVARWAWDYPTLIF